jgi:nucleoside phosphorylase
MPVTDYLVLTPLNEEFRYLRDAWPKLLREERVGKIHYYQVLHTVEHREAAVVFAAMGDMGQAWSGVFASEALRLWKPTTVVQVGIAGSVDKDVSLGDVVIPQEVIGYEVGDAIDTPNGPDIQFRSTGGQTDLGLLVAYDLSVCIL